MLGLAGACKRSAQRPSWPLQKGVHGDLAMSAQHAVLRDHASLLATVDAWHGLVHGPIL